MSLISAPNSGEHGDLINGDDPFDVVEDDDDISLEGLYDDDAIPTPDALMCIVCHRPHLGIMDTVIMLSCRFAIKDHLIRKAVRAIPPVDWRVPVSLQMAPAPVHVLIVASTAEVLHEPIPKDLMSKMLYSPELV